MKNQNELKNEYLKNHYLSIEKHNELKNNNSYIYKQGKFSVLRIKK